MLDLELVVDEIEVLDAAVESVNPDRNRWPSWDTRCTECTYNC